MEKPSPMEIQTSYQAVNQMMIDEYFPDDMDNQESIISHATHMEKFFDNNPKQGFWSDIFWIKPVLLYVHHHE